MKTNREVSSQIKIVLLSFCNVGPFDLKNYHYLVLVLFIISLFCLHCLSSSKIVFCLGTQRPSLPSPKQNTDCNPMGAKHTEGSSQSAINSSSVHSTFFRSDAWCKVLRRSSHFPQQFHFTMAFFCPMRIPRRRRKREYSSLGRG